MFALSRILATVSVFCLIFEVRCQCTFGATFASTSWHDNTKGTLTFTSTGMTGWSFKSIRTVGTSTISSWQCVNHTDDTYLILRTTSTFAFQPLSSTTSTNVYAYACLQLTSVTSNSFIYYQRQVQEINLGGERLKISASSALLQDDVCDTTITVPTTEYHVLVKSGSEASAAIQCPDSLLFAADFTYYGSDGSSACASSGDRWDVCADKSQMAITTNTCTQEIAFSADGNFYCVANIVSNGYDYTTVYNRDSTISSTTNRFACLSVCGDDISVAPGNCTAYQTPFSYPLEADQATKTGHRIVITDKYEDCGPSSGGLSVGEIVAIVISVLFIIYMWTLSIIFWIIFFLVAKRLLELAVVFVAEFTSYGDDIPRQKPSIPLKLDLSDIDTEKLAALEAGYTISPSKIVLNGHANGKIGTENERSGVHGQHYKRDEKDTSQLTNSGRPKLD